MTPSHPISVPNPALGSSSLVVVRGSVFSTPFGVPPPARERWAVARDGGSDESRIFKDPKIISVWA
jgi:hypothetical protein